MLDADLEFVLRQRGEPLPFRGLRFGKAEVGEGWGRVRWLRATTVNLWLAAVLSANRFWCLREQLACSALGAKPDVRRVLE